MITLTTRQCAILSHLLRADGPTTVAQIAHNLRTTPRAVRYDLVGIETFLATRSINLIKKPNWGVLIAAQMDAKTNLLRELTDPIAHRPFLSQQERRDVAILWLLTEPEPVLAKQLGCHLNVSYPTVLGDIRRAALWLSMHGVQVLGRPHVGYIVQGTERAQREALIELVLGYIGQQVLEGRTRPGPWPPSADQSISGPTYTMSNFIPRLELGFAAALVETLENLLPLPLADAARASLAVCIAILIERIGTGRTIEQPSEHLTSLSHCCEFQAATVAAEKIARAYGIALPEQEVEYIAIQLLGAGTRRPLSDALGAVDLAGLDPQVPEVVRDLVTQASAYLQPCLIVDQQLVRNLEFHIRAAVHRLRFDLPIRNPLLEDIKSHYPYVFQVAQRASIVLERMVGKKIPEAEIGYITMHLGAAMERLRSTLIATKSVLVVCGEGIATAWLLVSRLQAELPEVAVAGIASVSELSNPRSRSRSVAAIVSTVPLPGIDLPVAVVSPLLSREDVARVRAILEVAQIGPSPPSSSQALAGPTLADLLHTETIALQVTAETWVDVVYAAGNLLVATGAVDTEYVQEMKHAIETHGPYVVIMPEVALLHARPGKAVKRLGMSIVTLRKPVPFAHPRHDPVSVAVAMATTDNQAHWRGLRQLVDMLADREMFQTIRSAASKDQILELVSAVARACNR